MNCVTERFAGVYYCLSEKKAIEKKFVFYAKEDLILVKDHFRPFHFTKNAVHRTGKTCYFVWLWKIGKCSLA